MILTVAAFLLAVGLVLFAGGLSFGFKGVATIGGTLVFVVGVMVLGGGGLEKKVGEKRIEVDSNTTTVDYQYRSINSPATLSFGFLFSLLGGTLVLHALNAEVG